MSEHHEKAYQRIIHRVEKYMVNAEGITREELQRGVDQAIEFEKDIEELTRQEISLLGVYLSRDLNNLNRFMTQTGKGLTAWLKFDLELLEHTLLNMLRQVADKSVVDPCQLTQVTADDGEALYVSAEYVLVGTFMCSNCDTEQEFVKPGFLMDCQHCGGDQFQRTND
jgi:hypothetical protein